ncbi:MAG: thymidine phosphorylase, partial [Methanopyri archaeon]|nr:thymidine phosphorylase [Methanopyri archaeon]
DEPIGNGIGPVLEVRDVLKVLQNKPDAPKDLEEKSLRIAGRLIELIGIERFKDGGRRGDGIKVAEEVLRSGKAWKQMQKIIKAQGGDPKVSIEDLKLAPFKHDIVAERSGKMLDTVNTVVAKVARMAGSPQNKEAGVYLNRKFNEFVNRGDVLATVYAGSEDKLRRVKRLLDETPMFEVM